MNVITQDQLQSYISHYGEKTVDAILRLPEEDVTWIVYNANMIAAATTLIIKLRGIDYFSKYVRVASRDIDDIESYGAAKLYYEPKLFDYIGNGYD
jgi:hypothetical protein